MCETFDGVAGAAGYYQKFCTCGKCVLCQQNGAPHNVSFPSAESCGKLALQFYLVECSNGLDWIEETTLKSNKRSLRL